MKKTATIIIILLSMVISDTLNAQDLIVTKKNDSINCKITDIKEDFLYFDFMRGKKLTSTLLKTSDITTYKTDFYEKPEIPASVKTSRVTYNGKRFRISLQGGYGYRTAKIEENNTIAKEYIKGLKSGFTWDIESHYFINEYIGLGLKFNSFKSSNASSNIVLTLPDGSQLMGIRNEIFIHYFGPSVLFRSFTSNNKNAFISGVSLGYISYKNKEGAGVLDFTSVGHSVGISVSFGYDYSISENVSIGLSASYIAGLINEVSVTNENGDVQTINLKEKFGKGESLARINLSGGVRFYF